MVTCQKVLEAMERIAPKRLAEDWDNPGLLVGSPKREVTRLLVCLDVSDQVVARASQEGAELIVSHHPLIFRGLKKLRTDTPLGARLQRLLAQDIAVIAAHTNLDSARGGVNDVLAELLGLTRVEGFLPAEDKGLEGLGRIGRLEAPESIEAFGARVKAALPVTHIRLVRAGERPVQKVALCTGSGAEFIDRAAFLGADAYVTGDVKYHDAQHAAELGLHVIDGGHFGTEFPVVKALAGRLRQELVDVEVLEDTASKDFFTVL